MKRTINTFILIGFYLFVYLLIKGIIPGDCLFKKIFKISCPACGLTRSLMSILRLDLISSFKYNIFGMPLFIMLIVGTIGLVIDIIKGNNNVINYIFKYLGKYYYILIILLIISMVINNIRGI